MVRKFQINLTNKWLYSFIAVGVFILLGIGVYALTPGLAPNPGHTLNEIAPPTGCVSGQVLTWSGSSWGCVEMVGLGGSEEAILEVVTDTSKKAIFAETTVEALPPTGAGLTYYGPPAIEGFATKFGTGISGKSNGGYSGYFWGGRGVKIVGDLNVIGDINLTYGGVSMGYEIVEKTDCVGNPCGVSCPAGKKVIGGGGSCYESGSNIADSWPNSETSWSVRCYHVSYRPTKVYAICADIKQ